MANCQHSGPRLTPKVGSVRRVGSSTTFTFMLRMPLKKESASCQLLGSSRQALPSKLPMPTHRKCCHPVSALSLLQKLGQKGAALQELRLGTSGTTFICGMPINMGAMRPPWAEGAPARGPVLVEARLRPRRARRRGPARRSGGSEERAEDIVATQRPPWPHK